VHFIPTPGQTEQEYLAILHGRKNGWSKQNELDLSSDLNFNCLPVIPKQKLDLIFD